jgi:uncharacterized protein YacL
MVVAIRLLLALVGGVTGYELAQTFLPRATIYGAPYSGLVALCVLAGVGLGIFIGGLLGRATIRLGRHLDHSSARITASGLIFTTLGLIVGLGVAALAGLAIKNLPIVGPYLLPLLYAFSGYLFAYLGYKRHTDMARLVGFKGLLQQPGFADFVRPKLLDTSVIIDGRLGDIVPTDFLEGDLVIPGFVLEELQSIADSSEAGRRSRGRRGLETVERLQEGKRRVVIVERDFPGLTEVDGKLIRLAREMKGCILTTDYNLNKMASIQGVQVLNINELANALKPVVLPGESLGVRVLREGKEEDQGVAYLEDGTMVVIEGAGNRLGEDVEVEVTSVLQNPSGKMIFTRLAS